MSPGDDQRIPGAALRREERNPAQIQDVERGGVEGLVRQGNPDNVEICQSVFALQRVERDAVFPQGGFHIRPGGEDALGEGIFTAVDDLVQDGDAQVGHAQVVQVGEDQRDADGGGIPVLDDLVEFAAGVAARFLNGGQDARQARLNFGWCQHGGDFTIRRQKIRPFRSENREGLLCARDGLSDRAKP